MDIDLSYVKANENVPMTSRDRQSFSQLINFMNEESNKVDGTRIAQLLAQARVDEIETAKEAFSNIDRSASSGTGHRRIPGLTFTEETDLKSLEKYYDFLRDKYSRLQDNAATKYTMKEKRTEMLQFFEQKLSDLDKDREQRLALRKTNLALSTIKIHSNSSEDFLINAIYESSHMFPKSEQDNDDDVEGETLYYKEAGMLLDHIDIFMNLIVKGNYKEASYVAACSPKGVLRNMETLLKFKALKQSFNEGISPWLCHCKVLAETAREAPFIPNKLISLECAKAACSKNHIKFLYKWIAEERLTCFDEMAQLAERLNAVDLAEFIYRKANGHYEVASYLLQADKLIGSISHKI
ncbi:unnamed protein product [Rotaria magnacalcarata]|uniref:Clathrin heavy chain linker domain-containing protein 1 n=2 Tax=Rotaria magnacalcarata TaxID=392030 RepID=A0A815VPU2_9BILA|nr:unnamed protein product [Rotaria magnacalcarata]CAF4465547.1 unnamed protein product [Rotaria magnacalcarata]